MRMKRTFMQSLSIDSNMAYELYDLDDNPKTVNPKLIQGIRFALLCFLGIVMAGAVSVLAVGIWTLEAEYGNKQLSELINAKLYEVDSYMLIIGGAAIMIITVIGFAGVMKEYRCLVGLHLGLLAFMSVMLFVAGVLGYVLVSQLENKVRDKMEDALVNNYGIDIDSDRDNSMITKAWDRVQRNFKCCGVDGNEGSFDSWYMYRRSLWFTSGVSNGSYIPASCCASDDNIEQCTGQVNGTVNSPPRYRPPITGDASTWGYDLYTKGCFDVLDPYLHRTGIVIGTTAIVVGIFMLVELVLSVFLYRTLPEKT